MSISRNSIVVATDSQVSCVLDAETVILHFNKGVYFGLDEVGTSIWQKLQQPQVVGRIRDAILQEYDVDEEQCEQDVLRLLNQLHDEGLIEVRSEPAS
ncbi:MAG: PqqD family peptide modification chaperone [Acidobacteriia bacterium]|nr:PqqD family peptide modification chaperone [Terriglobia bacterium]